ncbi:MAG: hypothetical protein HY077_16665 [Elusimicrobia bacterium]|nr:hypothetical protein [Elusimicrobiota bacterium]
MTGRPDPFQAVFDREESSQVVEGLGRLTHLGRSSRYDLRRHGLMREAAYRKALGSAPSAARSPRLLAKRARAERILGLGGEARRALERAAAGDPRLPEAHAWLWELDWGAGRRHPAPAGGIDRAVALAPREPCWRVWRGLGRLPGRQARDQAACRKSLEDFEAALALGPACALAHAGRAMALTGLGGLRAAEAGLGKAIRLEPRQGWLHHLRARARLGLKDLDGFVADCESSILLDEALGDFANIFGSMPGYSPKRLAERADRYLARHPKTYWMHAFRGDCRRSPEVDDSSGALEDLETAVALRPDCSWAWAYLSRARLSSGLEGPALEAADRAVSLEPDCGWYRIWRGEIRRRLGETSAALRDFDRGLALSPDYELGYAWRGGAKLAARRPAEALTDLELSLKLFPNYAWAREQRAQALTALGPARSRKAGRSGDGHLTRARAAREKGELEEARRELDALVRLRSDAAAFEERAGLLSDMGFVVEALADMDRALKEAGSQAGLYARRAQFHLQRRNYPEAESDLGRAIKLAAGDPWLRAKRSELFTLTDRLPLAQEDLDRALALAPKEESLRLSRLRLLVQRGLRSQAAAEIRALLGSGSERGALEAVFYRGCLDFKAGKPGCGEKDFKKLMKDLPEEDPLSMRARFYWAASRAADPSFRKRHHMKTPKEKTPKLFLCGLGIFPPYTASLEVLHALSRCDVLFNNVAGPEVRELLAELCADIRPASYQAWQDEPRWADSIFQELDKGRKVGFVTRGHPLVFGGLAVELVKRCRRKGVSHETFGAVSSIDHLLAYTGKGLGDDFGGIQAVDAPAVERAKSVNTALPLLACFYSGLSGRAAVSAFRKSLERFYPARHGCWMFGPKYDAPPAVLALGELEKRYPEIHASLMLYVPPL